MKSFSCMIITIWTIFEKFFWLDFTNFLENLEKSNGNFKKIGISETPQNDIL